MHRYDAIVVSIIMTINEKYIEAILDSLKPVASKRFRDGDGYVFACPFCSSLQEKERKKNEKCAALTPLAGSYQWVFNCQRGIHNQKLISACNRPMRFDAFLRQWNPPLYRKYSREKELVKKGYQPRFTDRG